MSDELHPLVGPFMRRYFAGLIAEDPTEYISFFGDVGTVSINDKEQPVAPSAKTVKMFQDRYNGIFDIHDSHIHQTGEYTVITLEGSYGNMSTPVIHTFLLQSHGKGYVLLADSLREVAQEAAFDHSQPAAEADNWTGAVTASYTMAPTPALDTDPHVVAQPAAQAPAPAAAPAPAPAPQQSTNTTAQAQPIVAHPPPAAAAAAAAPERPARRAEGGRGGRGGRGDRASGAIRSAPLRDGDVYVGDLPNGTTAAEVQSLFPAGSVEKVEMGGRSAFVSLKDASQVRDVINNCNKTIKGTNVRVEQKLPREQRAPRAPREAREPAAAAAPAAPAAAAAPAPAPAANSWAAAVRGGK